MRILAVTNMYPTPQSPGSGTFVEQQVSGLGRLGLNVDVLFLDRRHTGMRVYRDLRQRLLDRAERFQPDIVHVMYGGVMAELATRTVRDRPTIVTFHGSDLLGEHLSGAARKLLAGYGVWASRRAARRATRVVVVSTSLIGALPRGLDSGKVAVIPCGIDLARFVPLDKSACKARLGWASDRFHVLFPSNSGDPVKRPQLALAAVEAARRLGVPAEIHYLRGLPNADVPIWMNASDALLLTSRHEGSPTVVKEALACNLPVVSVDVGDVRDQLDGVTISHVALPEPRDLAAKLHSVYSAPRGGASRANAERFSLDTIALRLETLYDDVLRPSVTASSTGRIPAASLASERPPQASA
jgi:teichuronic acid biosynthesis glycosyltransferase TuaC